MSVILQPYFWDEPAAHAKLEGIVWPNGPVCMRCGATDRIGAVTGKGARAGLKFCCRCRKQFRATIGTMFEGSHVPLHKWFQACFLLNAAGGAVSAHQLHLRLEVTNKTALGIVQRLAAVIKSAGNPPKGGLSRPSQAATVGSSQRALGRQPRGAPGAIGWEYSRCKSHPREPGFDFRREESASLCRCGRRRPRTRGGIAPAWEPSGGPRRRQRCRPKRSLDLPGPTGRGQVSVKNVSLVSFLPYVRRGQMNSKEEKHHGQRQRTAER